MSDLPPISPDNPASHRHASVNLRGDAAGQDQGPQLDPANQSLAEALSLVFKLLQVGMLGLFVYFALSGFQSIKENETGVRLVFGKPMGGALPPGFQFSYPYPVGELIKVDTGEQRLDLATSFWPDISAQQRGAKIEQLANAARGTVSPEVDGSLITGDSGLAHTQWQVRYSRANPVAFVENIVQEDEGRIVRAAVERGIVQAVAQETIDGVLKQTAGDQGSLAVRAQEIAQEMLDRIETGIRIDQLTLREKAPPLTLYNDFSGVQSAEQRANQLRDAAGSGARNTLNAAAGGAHPYLIEQISRYEAAIARNDPQEQARIMEVIRALFDGRPVEIDGQMVRNVVSGRVTATLNEARQHRTSVVTQARADLQTYQAKLEQFRINPDVVIQRDWTDAMITLLDRPNVEIFAFPPGTKELAMVLNRDHEIVRDFEKAQKEERLQQEQIKRFQEQNEARFKTDTNAREVEG